MGSEMCIRDRNNSNCHVDRRHLKQHVHPIMETLLDAHMHSTSQPTISYDGTRGTHTIPHFYKPTNQGMQCSERPPKYLNATYHTLLHYVALQTNLPHMIQNMNTKYEADLPDNLFISMLSSLPYTRHRKSASLSCRNPHFAARVCFQKRVRWHQPCCRSCYT